MSLEDGTGRTERGAAEISPERAKMVAYLRGRAGGLAGEAILARVRAAAGELDAALAGVTAEQARWRPPDGSWSIAHVVDHVAQTTIRVADELRHLLAGRRPPAPPVYEGLLSGAAAWVAWEELLDGLGSANLEFEAVLASAPRAIAPGPAPTARTILVVNRALAGGGVAPELFAEELDWKAYALVQRLHVLDHRSQVRALRAAAPR
jgi:hypothetical protein